MRGEQLAPAAEREIGIATLHGCERAQPEGLRVRRLQYQGTLQALGGGAEEVLSVPQSLGLGQIGEQSRTVAEKAVGCGEGVGGLRVTFQHHVGACQQQPALAVVGLGLEALGERRHHLPDVRIAAGRDGRRNVDGVGAAEMLIKQHARQRQSDAHADGQPDAGSARPGRRRGRRPRLAVGEQLASQLVSGLGEIGLGEGADAALLLERGDARPVHLATARCIVDARA